MKPPSPTNDPLLSDEAGSERGHYSQPPETLDRPAVGFLFSRLNYERTATVPYQERHFKLERMFELAERLGNPHEQLSIVHVAGSKGKGSTATMVASMLHAGGYRVGLYTSPHLTEPEERIQINLKNCSHDDFDSLLTTIEPHVLAMDELAAADPSRRGPTYFEILTAAAFLHFRNCQVDAAVVEVGLGGRLDSTNICRPRCSVITSISKDHTRQLGNTLSEIAGEKAGIIKHEAPVVSGVTDGAALEVIEQRARTLHASVAQLGRTFRCEPSANTFSYVETDDATSSESNLSEPGFKIDGLQTGMIGDHQMANASVAIRAIRTLRSSGIELSAAAIRTGLLNAKCQARIEIVRSDPVTILDAAHNEASARALAKTLKQHWPTHKIVFVLAATKGKDAHGILQHLLPLASQIVFTRYVENPRSFSPEKLHQLAVTLSSHTSSKTPDISIASTPHDAWNTALQSIANSKPAPTLICITGSFFLASELRPQLISSSSSKVMRTQ